MIYGNIEEMLATEGVYVSTTVGVSMRPLLRSRRDTVIIEPVREKLKRFDLPLYKRDGEYILHRIVEVTESGYVILGDNCVAKEYNVTDKDIVGVARAFYRGNVYFTAENIIYKAYSRVWYYLYPVRMKLRGLRGRLISLIRR